MVARDGVEPPPYSSGKVVGKIKPDVINRNRSSGKLNYRKKTGSGFMPPFLFLHHRPSAYMDNTRIREEMGYRPEYTTERAITAYIDWLRRHPE